VPELPDITIYVEAIAARAVGAALAGVRLLHPFVLRSVDPPLAEAIGRRVTGVRPLGKRIAIGLEGDLHLVVHLMIAGRLHWRPAGPRGAGRSALAALDFSTGTLVLTEAGTKRRASLRLVRGRAGLAALDPGGLEVLEATLADFRAALLAESHTLKRALTDPGICAGIGNAYSDEILHRARLSPLTLTGRLSDAEVERLWRATRETLAEWIARLRAAAAGEFPEGVTAFRPEMAVHGRYGQPCPTCGTPVQRIVHADNETNYCPGCQTGGRLLADRSLSRLMREDWPRSVEELEERRRGRR
jgi:formamidopyrimidine-DNA glycosylase